MSHRSVSPRRVGAAFLVPATLHILGLWAVAVVQPLLDLLGRSAEFFVAHGADGRDVLLLVAALTLLPPLLAAAAAWLAGVAGSVATSRALVTTFIAALAAALTLQVAGQAGVDHWQIAVPVGLAGGVAGVIAYRGAPLFRTFLSVLSVAAVVVPASFLTNADIRSLLVQPGDAGGESADAGHPPRSAPIVFVVIDEVPLVSLLDARARLDAARYPGMAALAKDGVWFRNATTVSDLTRTALPAILTGRYPRRNPLPSAAEYPQSVFTLVERTHRVTAVEPVTSVCPRRVCTGPERPRTARLGRMARDLTLVSAHVLATSDLRNRLPDVTASWADFGAARGDRSTSRQRRGADPVKAFEEFIETIDPGERREPFYFLHSLLSHHPFRYLPTGQVNATRASLPDRLSAALNTDEWEITHQQQRHLLQLAYVDALVQRLVDALRTRELYDRALILLVSDHGMAFRVGARLRGLQPETAGEVARVPLVVKFPSWFDTDARWPRDGDGWRISDRNVETIDIVPTIADVIGSVVPWNMDGVSLVDPKTPERPAKRIRHRFGDEPARFGPEGPSFAAALRAKLDRFGDPADAFCIPRLTKFAHLIGQEALRVQVASEDLTGDVAQRSIYEDVNPTAAAIPFDVAGRIERGPGNDGPLYVALAVNGVIRAVTRTWIHRPNEWLATVAPDHWRRGKNTIDVYVIEDPAASTATLRFVRPRQRPHDLNLLSGEATMFWNVRRDGFHRRERSGGVWFHWTERQATIVVPAAWGRRRSVRLALIRAATPGTRVRITANDCVLHDGPLPKANWEATFALEGCASPDRDLTISLSGEAPGGGASGPLRRGVAVRHVSVE